MKPNLAIVRDLIKKVHIVRSTEPLILDENYILSPMDDGNASLEDSESAHVHLLVKYGLLVFSSRIKSNRKPELATIEPTEKARKWAYYAFDDAKWLTVENDLRKSLERVPYEVEHT